MTLVTLSVFFNRFTPEMTTTLLSVYLADLCWPLTARSTLHLRSAEQGLLHVPFARTSTMQSRAFSVVGPLVWNCLPFGSPVTS